MPGRRRCGTRLLCCAPTSSALAPHGAHHNDTARHCRVAVLYANRALCHKKLGDVARQKEDAEKALALDREHMKARAASHLGGAEWRASGRRHHITAVASVPCSWRPQAHYLLGGACYETGHFELASAHLQKVSRPRDPGALLSQGRSVALAQGDGDLCARLCG